MKESIAKAKQPSSYYYDLYYKKKGLHHLINKMRVNYTADRAEGKEVLDIGCGCGVLASVLKNDRYCGVDIDYGCIEFAKKEIRYGKFICCDIKTFKAGRKFDVVVLDNVLEHFNFQERRSILINADKYLKINGLVVAVVPSIFFMKFIEPVFLKVRDMLDPGLKFDDEDFHDTVPLVKEICSDLPHYAKISTELLCFGMMRFVVCKKVKERSEF